MAANVSENQYKILTIQLPPNDMQRLKEAAEHMGVKHTVLARTLIHQGLQGKEGESDFPFGSLETLLAPLARQKGLTAKGVARRIKQVRRKRWEEQYKKPVEEVRKRQARSQ